MIPHADPPGAPSRWMLAAAAVLLLVAGAGGMYVWMSAGRFAQPEAGAASRTGAPFPAPAAAQAAEPASDELLPDVVIPVSREAMTRAGIEMGPVRPAKAAGVVRIPGTVQPDAYQRVMVTPLVSGRVTRVRAELGDRVAHGATLAEVYSPELAEAQTRFLALGAELDAHERMLVRTERLVEIGAASRQEMEQVHAEHTRLTTEVAGARSRLVLLGLTPEGLARLESTADVSSTVEVPAPQSGVVVERSANVGAAVDASSPLFTIARLSPVWIIGDLYERDSGAVRVGSRATITADAYPGLEIAGRVAYIAPDVRPETRTTQVRVEVANPGEKLRFGMYVKVVIESADASQLPAVPRGAVQSVGGRHFVYLVPPGGGDRIVEREVRVREGGGDDLEVTRGLNPGDVIVNSGSFYLRAESERLGLRQTQAPAPSSQDGSGAALQQANVRVTARGFEPSVLTLEAGIPARVTFIRTTDDTCATEVVFPALDIRRALPLGQPVAIDFTPRAPEVTFICGMDMLKGTIRVE